MDHAIKMQNALQILEESMKIDLHKSELSEAVVDLLVAIRECKINHDSILEIVHGFKHGQVLRNFVRSPKFIQLVAKEGFSIKKKAITNPGSTIFEIS